MNGTEIDSDRTDEATLTDEVSDEALEGACGARAGAAPTLLNNSYCFTCWSEGGAVARQAKARGLQNR